MMQQHQHYQMQLRKNENENCIQSSSISHASSIQPSSSSLSPNASYHNVAEKHETNHPLSIKHETTVAPCSVENGSRINSANRCNKAESYHQYGGGGSGKTVREELEASRSKIPKLGEFKNCKI
jgi:hypothetical protein